MKIAILSDIHDNLWNLAAALDACAGADRMICCGDLCSPFVVNELARFRGDVHIVFGNNDADLFRITTNAAKTSNVRLEGELYRATLDTRRFAVNHFDYLAKPMALSGEYDVMCFGHNHEFELARTPGGCLLINPGPIMGAKFSGGWHDVPATFVIYDTAADSAATFEIDAGSKAVTTRDTR